MCEVRPRLKDGDDFIKELRAYMNNEPGGEEVARWARDNGLEEDAVISDPADLQPTELGPNYSKEKVDAFIN
jgi:hypothetical protein